jgi:hypothetical protein
MTAREFLEQVVRPNVAELAADYADIRRAINAVHAVDALAAHIYDSAGRRKGTGEPDDTAFREKLASHNSDFKLLRDVAKAVKHVVLERGSPIVTKAEQITSKSLGWDEMLWDEGRWDSPPLVVVATNAGSYRVVETVLKNALDFLENEMARRGL